MSDDGFSDCFEESNMEIHIKTLLGTTFDIKVSPNDTIGDIKKKIYRVEGIPVYQQNLIFRSTELKDTIRLCDSGIKNGSILTLVPSMRGGPISTRRLSVACDHYFVKELRDLLENSRDEVNSGSKVSVLVFKEGDIINLLRVIENEDGSYSPYSEGTILPPTKSATRRDALETFQRLVEDTEMCSKLATIRKKMDELNTRRQNRIKTNRTTAGDGAECSFGSLDSDDDKKFSYKFFEDCTSGLIDNMDLTIFEKSDEGNQSESEEIALKDKHRTKPKAIQNLSVPKSSTKSLYSERKGAYSHTRQNYARIGKRRVLDRSEANSIPYSGYSRERRIHGDWEKSDVCLSNDLASLNLKVQAGDILKEVHSHPKNPFLGLKSSKLPDLSGSEKNGLYSNFERKQEPSELLGGSSNVPNDNSFPRLPQVSSGASNSTILPDIATRSLGPLIPDINPTNRTKLTSLDNKVANTSYSLPSTSRLFHSHSLESKIFPTFDTPNFPSKKNQSLPNVNSNTLESLPNLTRLETLGNISSSRGESPILGINEASLRNAAVEEMSTQLADQLHFLDDESNGDVYGESISVSARNRVHLTRLVLSSDGSERPKSSPNSIELEERGQDLWEIHEPASERLKHSATCKVGLVKRRQGLEYNYDSLENSPPNLNSDLAKFSKSSTEYGVCSGTNYYVPQYLSTPSAIPPQYAPKSQSNYCDLYFRSERRSPLYSRKNRNLEDVETNKDKPTAADSAANVLSQIQRLKQNNSLSQTREDVLHLYGYCSLDSTECMFEKEEEKQEVKLPPVIKKKSRCSECNKKLNITNIYNCRCGRIFCSQHRYSEAHRCTYDYKTEGRKILERQNPLVTAEKIKRL